MSLPQSSRTFFPKESTLGLSLIRKPFEGQRELVAPLPRSLSARLDRYNSTAIEEKRDTFNPTDRGGRLQVCASPCPIWALGGVAHNDPTLFVGWLRLDQGMPFTLGRAKTKISSGCKASAALFCWAVAIRPHSRHLFSLTSAAHICCGVH